MGINQNELNDIALVPQQEWNFVNHGQERSSNRGSFR
jgi:hypothetical protein